MDTLKGIRSAADLVTWLASTPRGVQLTIASGDLLELIRPLIDSEPIHADPPVAVPHVQTWRERLWEVPSETRLGVLEVAEALGRPKSWVYRHTSPASQLERLPHRKLDGELLFTAGELRAWIREHEEVVTAGPSDAPGRPSYLRAS